jgi:mono/diheme cytochrome c family protein
MEKFGCTICHEGQGLSTDYMNAAHQPIRGLDRPWQKSVLPRQLIQASCGKCHLDKEVPFAPLLSKGRDLLEKAGCSGCHRIRLYEEQPRVAPSLDRLGSKVNRAWLLRWLKDPREHDPAERLIRYRMPKFNLSNEDVLCLAEFLLASKDEAALKEAPGEGDSESGGLLFRESRCVTCHVVEEKGGYLAPELSTVTSKVSKEWLYSWMLNTHYFQPNTKMPQFNFTETQALDIVAYIWEQFESELPEVPKELEGDVPLTQDEKLKKGEKLFLDLGCSGCHPRAGLEPHGKIGAELTGLGARDEEALEWGSLGGEEIEEYMGNWVFLRLKDPMAFDKKAKMPDFALTDEESALITIALRSDVGDVIPAAYIRASRPQGYPKPPGEFGRLVDKYRCRSCHVVYGQGGWVSMHPLDMEGSQVKKEWLRHYFDLPYSLRPILKERMINLRMEPEEADFLTHFFSTVCVEDSLPKGLEANLTQQESMNGKTLFDKLGCTACHIVGGKGGYVGPPLDNAGDRLTAEWVFAFLKDPQLYKPWAIQPNYNLSDQQTRELTAYLMTLRETKKPGEKLTRGYRRVEHEG